MAFTIAVIFKISNLDSQFFTFFYHAIQDALKTQAVMAPMNQSCDDFVIGPVHPLSILEIIAFLNPSVNYYTSIRS